MISHDKGVLQESCEWIEIDREQANYFLLGLLRIEMFLVWLLICILKPDIGQTKNGYLFSLKLIIQFILASGFDLNIMTLNSHFFSIELQDLKVLPLSVQLNLTELIMLVSHQRIHTNIIILCYCCNFILIGKVVRIIILYIRLYTTYVAYVILV